MYDNPEYLNMSYPPNMTAEEQVEYITDAAKVSEQNQSFTVCGFVLLDVRSNRGSFDRSTRTVQQPL